MRDDPIHTFFQFMAGQIPDQVSLGDLRWFTVVLYWLIFVGGLAVAALNWRRDPQQRTLAHICIFLLRFSLAGMWYLGTLWKLPLPVSDGFKYWLQQTVKFSSFQLHADIMQVFLDHITLVQPLVYLLEIGFTAALMLGVLVRPASIVAALFTLNLLVGLYNDPTEWPWTYMGIICAHGMFAAVGAGRSLGLDNLIAKGIVPGSAGNGPVARVLRAAA